MNFWKNLPPQQQKMLMIGAPIVAVIVLLQTMRRPAAPLEDDAGGTAGTIVGTGAIDGWTVSTDAIGAGQLADFESGVSNSLIGLTRTITDMVEKNATTPSTGGAKPPAATGPAPALIGGQDPRTDPNNGKRTTTVQRMANGSTENLAQVARRVYRSGDHWTSIALWNKAKMPKGVKASTKLPLGTSLRY